MFFKTPLEKPTALRAAVNAAYRMDETACVTALLAALQFPSRTSQQITQLATRLIESARAAEAKRGGISALMAHYDLSTEEGILLMCLAEALLRVPDKETEDLLIRDKLTSAHWEKHIGVSQSSFVNLMTRGLAFTGKILTTDKSNQFKTTWNNLLARVGEPLIRQAVRKMIAVMSEQFILGRTIEEAIKSSRGTVAKGYAFSFDMLGEMAWTQTDAEIHFASYQHAIQQIGHLVKNPDLFHGPSISVKLSALYPRFEFNRREIILPALCERVRILAARAKEVGISINIDAEEADRLDLTLDVIQTIFQDPEFKDWEGFGFALQAYQKRAYPVITWLIDLARKQGKRIQVRLVKGAYWDAEIKVSQVAGFLGYPVFTRKAATDVSYLACAQQMLAAQDAIYPQFATHNAYSVAAILVMMDNDYKKYNFEFQKLQGMGEALHEQIVTQDNLRLPSRIYAPVGSYADVLPYLVRRLLENGANASFVNQIANPQIPVAKLIVDPVEKILSETEIPHPKIPLPRDIYGQARKNSLGLDFSDYNQLQQLEKQMQPILAQQWIATPLRRAINKKEQVYDVVNPANRAQIIGQWVEASRADIDSAMIRARAAYSAWDARGPCERAEILIKVSDVLEQHRAELMAMAVREAGKTLGNALNEVREAVDFCRYYAQMARETLVPQALTSPVGETNTLRTHGRGIILCISPWNFPIAIFTGQIAAALITGNAVIAKPAEQTPLVAAKIVELFHAAGVPTDVLQLLPGRGETVGAALVQHPYVDGVLFTGSTPTAKMIQTVLAARSGPIVPFIAETGGVNAMIADSTALPEQLIADVLTSAFDSAGQRCSALRVLFLQADIADKILQMLQGAMAELIVGDPKWLQTDVGPVIDKSAQTMLLAHADRLAMNSAKLIYRVNLGKTTQHGTFFAPQVFELTDLSLASQEVFGPILHVIRYRASDLDKVIDAINALNYGLTFGIQSRINSTIEHIQQRIHAGNIYVNRNMIGAVVGVQPFGGGRLSGTGPKAGGPHYLPRLCNESTLTINTAAVGGNATLLTMKE